MILIQDDEEKASKVRSAITENGGIIEEELGEENKPTHIVVDTHEWDIIFDDCLDAANGAHIVHCDWVFRCVVTGSLVPVEPYVPKK